MRRARKHGRLARVMKKGAKKLKKVTGKKVFV